ncbi:MAG: type I-F CRISPR-associated protein Csy1 [Fluviicoccus sp.]|uniref:type I-F CRISPR-associated protein Csy1 n=1 Tax=Fluviicoccus sp. TaxID=2003552 RepID=UPI0027268E3B|nr:type I-F CRISPR-associated protein Csy1 [Fluviicoccus sp.]MDO8330880.1 type I-F CRISPR-associated protein Csy1 [Fluviicoccus sp.]
MESDASHQNDAAQWRQVIHAFIHERKQVKLDSLKPEDVEERLKNEDKFQPESWLASAALRVSQIQMATHTPKFTHPDLKPVSPKKQATSLFVSELPCSLGFDLVSSACLKGVFTDDVVGNAAALDVYKFLKLEHKGKSLLHRIIEGDDAVRAALSDDQTKAESWMKAFAGITVGESQPMSNTLAKQIFFPLTDGGYHLLAPLFPTSLINHVYWQMREDRFGETAKASREARKLGLFVPQGFKEYPDLVIQNFGGSNTQNVSQLNAERNGENWLLASLPPIWHTNDLKPPTTVATVFDKWLFQRRSIRELTRSLREFLKKTGDYTNINIRQQRADLVARIVDEVFLFSFELLELPAGWSAEAGCRLDRSEALWLDPNRRFSDDDFRKEYEWKDWPEEIARRFGNWLNAVISTDRTPMGEAETLQWQRDLEQEVSLFRLEM